MTITDTRTCDICGEPSNYLDRAMVVRADTTGAAYHDRCLNRRIREREQTTYNQAPITVRVVDFKHGLRQVKAWGSRYNPQDKTWTVPAKKVNPDTLRARGLTLARATGPVSRPDRPCPRCHTYCDGDCAI